MGWKTKELVSIYSSERGFSLPSPTETGVIFKNNRAHLNEIKVAEA
jgi:hypothetical protein